MRITTILLAAVSAAGLATAAQALPSEATFAYSAGNTVFLTIDGTEYDATNQGWINDLGNNNGGGAGGNYIAGRCGSSDACNGDDTTTNDYFTFDLTTLSSASSATITLYQPLNAYGITGANGYISDTPSLNYALFDYTGSTPVTSAGLAGYTDLGSGVSYGSTTVDASTNGNFVTFSFNAAGIAALNAAAGDTFTVGGSVTDLTSTAVPESTTWTMMIAGIGMAGAAMRRSRKAGASLAHA